MLLPLVKMNVYINYPIRRSNSFKTWVPNVYGELDIGKVLSSSAPKDNAKPSTNEQSKEATKYQ